MRLLVALQTCFGLLVGFFFAPFEHVHQGGTDHEHGAEIHAHFYSLPTSRPATGLAWDDVDDDHAMAWSVDTLAVTLPAANAPFLPSRGPVLEAVRREFSSPVEAIEERAHAPPARERSIPRAPPC